ncbi:MAG: nicotinate (nicotinamide) nucleotide adenylyltransferase, partial [Clostridia bacterium]|nr:nicotinate (nicotinamide) nucleotide adenylyltransferase [Clostridia bacterium]
MVTPFKKSLSNVFTKLFLPERKTLKHEKQILVCRRKKKYNINMITIFFGGAFDPFHNEHRALIVGAQKELSADRVVVYPSYSPPHKGGLVSPFETRMEMAREGTKDLSYVVVDDIEKQRGVTNYSYEVIPLLKKKYPSDEYYFLIGGDSMAHFSKWVRPETIAKEITLAVAARPEITDLDDAVKNAKKDYGASIVLLSVVGGAVSSSLIKARAELGLPQVDLCAGVRKIVEEGGLYRRHADIVDKLRADIPQKTFDHVCRTVLYALKLNTSLNLPFKKVFLSALLHDCAKHEKTEMEGVPAPVTHQYVGADVARDVYGVEDKDILDAIRCHTT